MNWLLIAAAVVLLIYIIIGYNLGFLRSVFSIGKWILLVALVILLTPGLTSFLQNHTKLQDKLETKIELHLEDRVEKAAEEKAKSLEEKSSSAGIDLPEAITEKIPELVGAAVLKSDTCQKVAEDLAPLAVKGIAGLAVIVLGLILILVLSKLIKLVDKIPVVGKTNKILGIAAGACKGLIVIWIFMALVAAEVGTGPGQFFYSYIEESAPLNFVYENNLILTIVMAFF